MSKRGAKKKGTSSKSSRKKARGKWLTASACDPHILYEKSVQEPEAEVEFILQAWRERRKRRPTTLREDFCGTAIASCAWVKHRRAHTAVGIDIDPNVLAWARQRLPERVTNEQRSRLTLLQGDVMKARVDPVDTLVALNFSYFLFKERSALKRYFQRAFASLVDDGLLIIDAYGGSESFEEIEEERNLDGFTYVWDQHHVNPITHHVINHIHFRFPDGTEIKRAFTYDWRLWTLPELREVLLEAGFRRTTVYWEGTDPKTGEGNSEFTPSERGEACAGWIAYIVAEKRI